MDATCQVNIYAPSGSEKKHDRNVFFGQDIFGALTLHHEAAWVIGGDFNCVLGSVDVEGGVGFSQKFCPSLKDLVRTSSLSDVFRLENPRAEEFTFFRAGKINIFVILINFGHNSEKKHSKSPFVAQKW